MPATPEAQAREEIDRLLAAAGWHVCGVKPTNIHAARGLAIREFPLAEGYGQQPGALAAKLVYDPKGPTTSNIEARSARSTNAPNSLALEGHTKNE